LSATTSFGTSLSPQDRLDLLRDMVSDVQEQEQYAITAGNAIVSSNSLTDEIIVNSFPSLEPMTVPFSTSENHRQLSYRQITSKHPLNCLYSLLVLHRQGCHPHTPT
jgi:hypothetical protein